MNEPARPYSTVISLAILLVVMCMLLALAALYARARGDLARLSRQPREIVIETEPVNGMLLCALDDVSNQLVAVAIERDALRKECARWQTIVASLTNGMWSPDDVQVLQVRLRRLEAEQRALRARTPAAAQSDTVTLTRTVSILGIPMRERKLVFLIDTSGSMQDEGRFAEVRGAMKVVLRTLDSTHQVDLMTFTTDDQRAPVVQPLWGSLNGFGEQQRAAAVQFLMHTTPRNGTPTVDAIRTALARYPDVEALILLSDGEPTDYDAYGVEWERAATAIEQLNPRRVPIYTIGVGPRMGDVRHGGRRFMERVALMSHAASSSF